MDATTLSSIKTTIANFQTSSDLDSFKNQILSLFALELSALTLKQTDLVSLTNPIPEAFVAAYNIIASRELVNLGSLLSQTLSDQEQITALIISKQSTLNG